MLTAYLKLEPNALNIVQKMIANFLLNDENDEQIKDEALREIPNLMIMECIDQNWKILISSLAEMLHTILPEKHEKIIRLFAHFAVYLGTERLQKILSELTTKQYEICKKYERIIFETSETMKESLTNKEKIPSNTDVELRYRFGIIPVLTSNMLNNETDPTSRIIALEQVNEIMNGITPEEARKFATHLHSYFLTLGNVLDDLNFKVVTLCLDVLRLTLEKVGSFLAPYTQQVVGLISKHFGNQKSAIRQQIMAICMITMQNCSPKSVISYLCVYSEHRSSRIREEILNIMTAALLTFDSRMINLKAIADIVVPLLADQKRRVRLAAFELFAVFAHLSSKSIKGLLKSVSNLEQKHRAYGLLNAVKARISRKTLPKIRPDGLIEYATPVGTGISINRDGWQSLKMDNLDYEWIMSGSSGSSSILSRRKWPSVSSLGKQSSSSVPTSENALAEIVDSNDDIPWKENFNEMLVETKNVNIPGNDTKISMIERPYSDDCNRYKHNGNGMHEKCWDDDPSSHSVDRIHLEKLQLDNNLYHTTNNDSDTIHKNRSDTVNISNGIKKELSEENFTENGSNGIFMANNISLSRKVTNPNDLPIKPSKSGNYYDGYAPSEPAIPTRPFQLLVRKSFSHQNLASTSKTTAIPQGLEDGILGSSSLSLGTISRSGSIRRSGGGNGRDLLISQGIQQDLLEIRNNLIASEWERRMQGLKEFSEIVMRNDRAAISDTKVLGAFVGRTSDINFKVSVEAMETLITILPILSPHFSNGTSLKAVLYQLINSLMSHLASRSEGHRQHAKLCFEEITKYIENVALLAPFAAATKQANVKQKPFMLHTLSKLMESGYSIKPRQAEAAGLPVLWELLKTPPRSCSDPEVRDAIRHYAITMARCLGIKTLLDLSTFRINPSQKKILQELIS
ncbi:hypothetical protein LOAG_17784 [Loa loa]|uniref:TOG domain-containing protein n=1 Tax=Loa loa TaxID=7209 RepID=A0A1S0UHH6_LOALO|nr:hypothetical protein LOAG_17784 [Loa loa]EJD74993.1 hypothetical protein LOAG_17784 [Loa loa]